MKPGTCGFINVRDLAWSDYWSALRLAQTYQTTSPSMAKLVRALLESYTFSDTGAHYIEQTPIEEIFFH
jgi:hypothetical protein